MTSGESTEKGRELLRITATYLDPEEIMAMQAPVVVAELDAEAIWDDARSVSDRRARFVSGLLGDALFDLRNQLLATGEPPHQTGMVRFISDVLGVPDPRVTLEWFKGRPKSFLASPLVREHPPFVLPAEPGAGPWGGPNFRSLLTRYEPRLRQAYGERKSFPNLVACLMALVHAEQRRQNPQAAADSGWGLLHDDNRRVAGVIVTEPTRFFGYVLGEVKGWGVDTAMAALCLARMVAADEENTGVFVGTMKGYAKKARPRLIV